MILKKYEWLIVLSIVSLACFLAGGCATKAFVRERIQEIEGMAEANKAQIEQLDKKLTATDAKAEEALNAAQKALRRAEEASGYVGYKPLGEREVNFDFDRYDLNKFAKDILDEIGTAMLADPKLIIEIEGHTDNVASDDYNLTLGRKRAESVQRYLGDKYGIALHRMFSLSYGESKLKVVEDVERGSAANRRAVLRLLGPTEE